MKNSKLNPSKFDCYSRAEPDEPMFVLLARDKHAPALVRSWARARRQSGEDDAKVEEAFECADAMEAWREERKK